MDKYLMWIMAVLLTISICSTSVLIVLGLKYVAQLL